MTNTTRVRLGEVVDFVRTSVRPESIDTSRDYVLLEHIVARTGEVAPVAAGDYDIRSPKYEYEAGDVLYGKLRPNLRKACVAPRTGYCSTDILPLRPRVPSSSFYLASILRSERFYAEVERLVSGANLPRVNPQELLDLEIPWLDDAARAKSNDLARIASELRTEIAVMSGRLEQFERSLWA